MSARNSVDTVKKLPIGTGEPPLAITKLSKRERNVLEQVLKGLSNADVGKVLGITEPTVKYHMINVYKKTGVHTRFKLLGLMHNKSLDKYPPGELTHDCTCGTTARGCPVHPRHPRHRRRS